MQGFGFKGFGGVGLRVSGLWVGMLPLVLAVLNRDSSPLFLSLLRLLV